MSIDVSLHLSVGFDERNEAEECLKRFREFSEQEQLYVYAELANPNLSSEIFLDCDSEMLDDFYVTVMKIENWFFDAYGRHLTGHWFEYGNCEIFRCEIKSGAIDKVYLNWLGDYSISIIRKLGSIAEILELQE